MPTVSVRTAICKMDFCMISGCGHLSLLRDHRGAALCDGAGSGLLPAGRLLMPLACSMQHRACWSWLHRCSGPRAAAEPPR